MDKYSNFGNTVMDIFLFFKAQFSLVVVCGKYVVECRSKYTTRNTSGSSLNTFPI